MPTETRIKNGHLQAHIVRDLEHYGVIGKPNNKSTEHIDLWEDIPEKAILDSMLNPRAGPSVCWSPVMRKIVCFMEGNSI